MPFVATRNWSPSLIRSYNNAIYSRNALTRLCHSYIYILIHICIQRRFFSIFYFYDLHFSLLFCRLLHKLPVSTWYLCIMYFYKERIYCFVESTTTCTAWNRRAAILCESIILRYRKTAHRQHKNSYNVKRSGLCCNYQYWIISRHIKAGVCVHMHSVFGQFSLVHIFRIESIKGYRRSEEGLWTHI